MEPWTEYVRFVVALFAIVAPFEVVPLFLVLTRGLNSAERHRAALGASVTVVVVLGIAMLFGESFLRIIGTSLDAFRIGGGLVLLLMALSMLNARMSPVRHTPEEADEAGHRTDVGVVPLGLPLLAGPGAISSVIIQANRGDGPAHLGVVFGCIVLIALVLWVALRLAEPIGRFLGQTGFNILSRLFGLLLAAVAAQIIANGMLGLFPGLRGG